MVVNYGSSSPEMYPDFSIVPESTYTSPMHSPFAYQHYDAVNSPASSDVSSVDSAFDELAGVIPGLDAELSLSGSESPKCYQNLSTMSPYASSGYYEESLSNSESEDVGRLTPSMYDSYYAYPEKPSENPVVKQIRSSAKRQLPEAWYSNYSDLSELGFNENAKRMRMSNPVEMARHAENLLGYQDIKPMGEQLKSMYEENYPEAVGQDFNNNEAPSPAPSDALSEESDAPNAKNQNFLMFWDEDVLTKGFEILAEYISRDTTAMSEPKSSPEEIQQLKSPRQHKRDALSDIARYQAAIQEAASARQKEQESTQQMTNEPPLMFSMSNVNSHNADPKKLSLKQERSDCRSAAEMIRNWKIPAARPRRANLCLQSTTKPRLYNFLHELLQDPERYPCIEWVDESQGIFKFLDSAQIASLWGHRKNKPHMKYENFARSLRTYIAKGILTKPRNKLVYQFTSKMV